MLRIAQARSGFEREPLASPFGFKGGSLTELWQTCVRLTDGEGHAGLGLGTQSVLWSDADVFRQYSEAAGNAWMYLLTELACRWSEGRSVAGPGELLDGLLPYLGERAERMLGRRPRPTFLLNALVPLDNAAWLLLAARRGERDLDALVPAGAREALSCRHEMLAWAPLIPYGTPLAEVRGLAEAGACVLKVKLGSAPRGDGDPEAMLEWDRERLAAIHATVRDLETPTTDCGSILYYLDANGRYDSRERLERLLDHAERTGARDRILLLEEPFAEESEDHVGDLGVRVAADESAHTAEDAARRIEMGYGAIALKPVAKTLTMSLRIARVCHERGVPCFCADLTVNPLLLEWNKWMAARLAPLPGLRVGLLEANGRQHYRDWARLLSYHPHAGGSWVEPRAGAYRLDSSFYGESGGIFSPAPHYEAIVG